MGKNNSMKIEKVDSNLDENSIEIKLWNHELFSSTSEL